MFPVVVLMLGPPLDEVGAAVPLLADVVAVVVAGAEVPGFDDVLEPAGGPAVELQLASPNAMGTTASATPKAASLDAGMCARIIPRFVD